MFMICRKMYLIDPFSLMCLEYFTTDYLDFIGMMLDFKHAFMWTDDQNEEEQDNDAAYD